MMRTMMEIAAELFSLRVSRDGVSVEPVTMGGWYENTDGTVTRSDWRDGALHEGPTVKDWKHVAQYIALESKLNARERVEAEMLKTGCPCCGIAGTYTLNHQVRCSKCNGVMFEVSR